MRIKKGFNLRNICDERILVAEGIDNIDFSEVIGFNESAAYIWDSIVDKDFTADDLAELMAANYQVSKEDAKKDTDLLLKTWKEVGLVED